MSNLVFVSDHDAVWDRAAPLLRRACDMFDAWSVAEAYEEIARGNAALWALYNGKTLVAAIVTQVDTKTGNGIIALIGGRGVLAAIDDLAKIEAWAKHFGAKRMAMDGRKGWVRALRRFGYSANGTLVTKELG